MKKLLPLLLLSTLLVGCRVVDVRYPDYDYLTRPWNEVVVPVGPPDIQEPPDTPPPTEVGDTATALEGIQARLDAGERIHMDEVKALVGNGWRQKPFYEDGEPVEAWQYRIVVDGRTEDGVLVFSRATGLLKRTALGF